MTNKLREKFGLTGVITNIKTPEDSQKPSGIEIFGTTGSIDKSDMLEELLKMQKTLQESGYGFKFEEMTSKDRASYIKENILWTSDELHEMLHELPWAKSWSKKYSKPEYSLEDQERLVKEEMIDALHFFMNILIASGFTGKELFNMYIDKNKENYDRIKRGY